MDGQLFDVRRAARLLESQRDRYLADLQRLVAIDSGTFDRAGVNQVVDILEGWYRELGCSVERRRHDVYGDTLMVALEGPNPGRILLLGHTDTVYRQGTAAERPMRVDGERVAGPGTADMKAGDVSILYALRALLDQGREQLGNVVIVHNSDEEIGSPSSKALISEQARVAQAVLVLEPGRENGDVVVARKGVVDIQVWFSGRSAHAGVNHAHGRSAILSLARFVTEVEALNRQDRDVTVNVGMVDGGERTNVVPDRAYCRLEVRAFDRDILEETVDQVRMISVRTPVEGSEARLEVSVEHWPMHRSAGTERLYDLARRIGAEVGLSPGAAATGGASDGNTAAAAGRAVLDGLGPVGGGAHSEREYIKLESVAPRCALLAGLVAELRNGTLDDAVSA